MALSEALLPEFDHEMANTRKTLERVPDDKFAWKPHEKSGTMGWLLQKTGAKGPRMNTGKVVEITVAKHEHEYGGVNNKQREPHLALRKTRSGI